MKKEQGISLAVLVFAMAYFAGSFNLEVGTISQPGPGFLPIIIAGLLIIFAGVNLYNAFKLKEDQVKNSETINFTIIGIVTILFIYPFALKFLNYIIATSLAIFVLFRLFKYKTWLHSLIFALLAVLISFVLFAILLGVVLPAGPIEDLLLML